MHTDPPCLTQVFDLRKENTSENGTDNRAVKRGCGCSGLRKRRNRFPERATALGGQDLALRLTLEIGLEGVRAQRRVLHDRCRNEIDFLLGHALLHQGDIGRLALEGRVAQAPVEGMLGDDAVGTRGSPPGHSRAARGPD